MTNEQFETYYKIYHSDIQAIARRFARTDEDLFDDLFQEGRLALLAFDPAKVHSNEKACVLQAVRNRIIDWLRAEKRDRTESLNALIANGDQITADDDGKPRLAKNPRRRNEVPAYEDEDDERWIKDHSE
jgi:RNA polymerase sigma factor (sigma-70 family)